jgi:hypothetical protein
MVILFLSQTLHCGLIGTSAKLLIQWLWGMILRALWLYQLEVNVE